ncbi:MAG: ABC transporter permease [Candidatus Heimdallarchaeaceae archaeon]
MALRNVFRQKTRTALTVLGILIGIAAIVALGSISEGLRSQISESLEKTSGLITVVEDSSSGMMGMMTSELTEETFNEIVSVDGIKEYAPIIYKTYNFDDEDSLSFSSASIVIGIEPEKVSLYLSDMAEIEEGEELEEDDIDYAVLGSKAAKTLDLEIGDTITVEGMDFQVKGIYEEIGSEEMDSMIVIPLESSKNVFETDKYSMVVILPDDIDEVEDLANEINGAVDDVSAITTAQMSKQIGQIIDQISFFTLGISAISAIVGGLGVMNTMIMSVIERRREIGVLKAIGATNSYVIKMILIESGIISLIGGLTGLGVGFIASKAIGVISHGSTNGIVTPTLALYSLIFALFLGMIGGLYPAQRAAKLSPIEALRYE